MDKLEKLDNILLKIESVIAGTALCVIVVLISGNVLTRFAFQTSLAWAEELSYISFTWLVFWGVSILYAKRSLITIDVVVDRLGPKGSHIIEVVTDVILLVMNICLVVWAMQMTMTTTRITSILKIPYNIVYFGMALAFLFMVYNSVKFVVFAIMGKEIQKAAIEERA